MAVRQPRYSKEEFARRGNELYERQIRAQVEAGNTARSLRSISKRAPTKWQKTSSRLPTASWRVTQMPKPGLCASARGLCIALAPTVSRSGHDHRDGQRAS